MKIVSTLLVALGVMFGVVFCSSAEEKPMVVVSIPPQADMVRRLAGNLVEVETLLPPSANPHTFELSVKQLKAISKAKMIFAVGHPDLAFEQTIIARAKSEASGLKVVDCSQGFPVEEEDPHVWSSVLAMKLMVTNMATALREILPADVGVLSENENKLQQELASLDAEIRGMLVNAAKKEFFVFHPAWGYFAKDYGLIQVAIEEHGHEPGVGHTAHVLDSAKAKGAKVIFIQPQTSRQSAETVANEVGARLEVLDPMKEDWFANMRYVATQISKTLSN